MSKTRVVLHGYLADLHPDELELDAENLAELINGMCKVTGHTFNAKPGQGKHCIRAVGFETVDDIYAPLERDEVHLVPQFAGGKESGGFIQVAIGAVLIAASFFVPGAQAGGALGYGMITSTSVFMMGATMALGGLMQVISPAPTLDTGAQDSQDVEDSKYLGADQNTVKIGTRIPLLYGEHIGYGHFLSFNVDAKEVDV
jgi:predicted phage tail protein